MQSNQQSQVTTGLTRALTVTSLFRYPDQLHVQTVLRVLRLPAGLLSDQMQDMRKNQANRFSIAMTEDLSRQEFILTTGISSYMTDLPTSGQDTIIAMVTE
jgi:hypothetical protein